MISLNIALENSTEYRYAPWIHQVTTNPRGAIAVIHCAKECDYPGDNCECSPEENTTTATSREIRTAYTAATLAGALCCTKPENFCAEDADQILQRLAYGKTIFG